MDLKKFMSKSASVGEIYHLEHFRTGWKQNVRRLMGNELVYPPSPKVIEAVKNIASSLNYYPEDSLTDVELREKLAEYSGVPGRKDWITCGNGSMEIIDMPLKSSMYFQLTRISIIHSRVISRRLPRKQKWFCYLVPTIQMVTT